MNKPCIVWQTDFSRSWGAVASMVGVCKSVDPQLECVDITHDIPAYDIWTASMELAYVEPYWPKGTIFVSVVDPGVGTSRRACAVLLDDGSYVLTPDNGTLSHLMAQTGIKAVREIDELKNRLPGSEGTSVFHGRDIFAYTAARLASGVIGFQEIGAEYSLKDLVIFEEALKKAETGEKWAAGIVRSVSDPFGSVVFNISAGDARRAGFVHGDILHVKLCHAQKIIFEGDVLYQKAFGYVDVGTPVLFDSSYGYLSIGINQGSFLRHYPCQRGFGWVVNIAKESPDAKQ